MKSICLFLLSFLFSSFIALAENRYNWPPYTKQSVPDSLAKEDAIYLVNATTIDYMETYETNIVYFKRIHINTRKGAEDFSSREIYQFSSGKIALKATRIIKPDGSILELGDEHIIETFLEEKGRYEDNHYRRIQFVFPTLEPGDVIDIVYQVDYNYPLSSNTLYLEDDLCSLSSQITIRNAGKLGISLYPSEGMKDYTTTRGLVPAFAWVKKGVPKQIDGLFNAPRPGSPSVVYVVWHPETILNYADIWRMDYEKYNCPAGASFLKALIREGVVTVNGSSSEQLLVLINHLGSGKFRWVPENEVSPSVKTTTYYTDGLINNTLFFRYIQAFCTEYGLSYEKGYTRSLLNGVFRHGFVSFDQLDLRFLLINDEDGEPHYLFGPGGENRYFHLDEIPYFAEGNQSVVLSGKGYEYTEASAMQLPLSIATDNKHTASLIIKWQPENTDSLVVKRSDVVSGHYSYLLKTDDEWLKTFAISDTTIAVESAKDIYPYELAYKQEKSYSETELISAIDDTLSWIKPANFLPHDLYFENETLEEMGEYIVLPFLRYDKFSIYIEAPDSITLLEKTTTFSTDNTVGKLVTNAVQVNPKVIKITYELQLKRRIVETEQQRDDLQQLLDDWHAIQAKKWVIRKNQL